MGWVQAAFSALLLVGSIHDLTVSAKGGFSEEMAEQVNEAAEEIADDEYERLLDGDIMYEPDIEKRNIIPEMEYEEEDDADMEKRDINPEEMEDEEEDEGIKKRQIASAARFVPAFTPILAPPPPPPNTIGSARRVSFDYSTNVDSIPDSLQFNATDGGLRFLDSSFDDEGSSEWSLVTPTGYEYDGSPGELKKLFASARLASVGYEESGSFSGKPTGDGTPDPTGDSTPDPTVPVPPTATISSLPQAPTITTKAEHIARIQRSVFGIDTRIQVTMPSQFPWAAMGRIDSGCTGTFIGPRHILTAGHCVYSHKTKKWLRNLNFRRAKNCDPHCGSLYRWKWAITVKGWKKYGWKSYDYAMIVVDRPSPYYMSYGWKKPIPKWTVNIAGYPGDKPGRCMWRTHCKIRNRFNKWLGYKCDTYNGMSGSAVYAYWRSTNKRIIYCIHTYGKAIFSNFNKCTRITKSRFNQFKNWIQNYN